MKEHYIADLEVQQEFVSFFLIKSVEVKRSSNGKNYLDFLLADKSGEISAKKWDLPDEYMQRERPFAAGDVIKVAAQVSEFKGMKQLRISKIRMTGPEDAVDMADYIKTAPESGEEMFAFLYAEAQAIGDAELSRLCTGQLEKFREQLLYYPAAAKNHHAERSGLLWHMKRMLLSGKALCGIYTFLDADWVKAGVILHDLQKIQEILSDRNGVSEGYSFEGKMLGHLVMGVRELEKEMEALGFDKEKKILVEHMILSHHYEPEFGSPVRPLFPEAEMLHHLDMMDARMYDVEEAMAATRPGEFSGRVWTLHNRQLYKRKEEADKQGAEKQQADQ